MPGDDAQYLDALAAMLGVTRSYHDGTGQFRRASDESVLAVVRALGAPVERMQDCGEALRCMEDAQSQTAPPAVAIIAERTGGVVELPQSLAAKHAHAVLVLESGETRPLRTIAAAVQVPREVPIGCHHLDIGSGSDAMRTHVLVVPDRLPEMRRSWCAFRRCRS